MGAHTEGSQQGDGCVLQALEGRGAGGGGAGRPGQGLEVMREGNASNGREERPRVR